MSLHTKINQILDLAIANLGKTNNTTITYTKAVYIIDSGDLVYRITEFDQIPNNYKKLICCLENFYSNWIGNGNFIETQIVSFIDEAQQESNSLLIGNLTIESIRIHDAPRVISFTIKLAEESFVFNRIYYQFVSEYANKFTIGDMWKYAILIDEKCETAKEVDFYLKYLLKCSEFNHMPI